MARQPRIEHAGAIYHVLSRGNERGKIFVDDEDKKCFLSKLEKLTSVFLFRIHAYVLMSNHFPLLFLLSRHASSSAFRGAQCF